MDSSNGDPRPMNNSSEPAVTEPASTEERSLAFSDLNFGQYLAEELPEKTASGPSETKTGTERIDTAKPVDNTTAKPTTIDIISIIAEVFEKLKVPMRNDPEKTGLTFQTLADNKIVEDHPFQRTASSLLITASCAPESLVPEDIRRDLTNIVNGINARSVPPMVIARILHRLGTLFCKATRPPDQKRFFVTGIDYLGMAEVIYGDSEIVGLHRTENTLFMSTLHNTTTDFYPVKKILDHAASLLTTKSETYEEEIWLIGYAMLNHCIKHKRWADCLTTIRSIQISSKDYTGIERKLILLNHEAEMFYRLGAILKGYKVLCHESELLMACPDNLVNNSAKFIVLFDFYQQVLVNGEAWPGFGQNTSLVCGNCSKTITRPLSVGCICLAIWYCNRHCWSKHQASHGTECNHLQHYRSKNTNTDRDILPSTMLKLAFVCRALLGKSPEASREIVADKLAKFGPLQDVRFFDNRSKRFVCHWTAHVLEMVGNYEGALEYATAAENTYGENELSLSRGWNAYLIGVSCSELKRWENARTALDLAQKVIRASKYPCPLLVYKLIALAGVCCNLDQYHPQKLMDLTRYALTKYPVEQNLSTFHMYEDGWFPILIPLTSFFYGLKHFTLANRLCNTLANRIEDLGPNYAQPYQNLKDKIARALRNPKECDANTKTMPRVCAFCWRLSKGKPAHPKCSGCRLINYCSAECQNKHWPEHKDDCTRYRPGRKATQKFVEEVE
jgi:hypothetical protein